MKESKTFFIAILILFFIIGCSEKDISDKKKTQKESLSSDKAATSNLGSEEDVDQKITAFSISGTTKAKKKWSIEGESADVLNSNIIKLKSITGRCYLKDDIITITADEGKFNRESNKVQLSENVIAKTENGVTLKTEHLNWNAEKEYIWTDDFVEITRDKIKITGYGASGYSTLEKVKLDKNIKINIEPSAVITCDGPLQTDYNKGIGYLDSNVKVIDKAGKLIADKAKVYFDKKDQRIIKVVAIGNVKIKKNNDITFSHRVTYFVDDMKVILTGKPKLLVYSSKDNRF